MKRDDPIAQILAHTMFLGLGLGAAMGLVFQAIFFHLSWQTSLWGFGFGAIGGLVVGIIDGINALWILLRFYRSITNVTLYRLVLNGILLLATIATTIAVYTPVFWIISGSISSALLFAFPIVFLSAICSLIASHVLGSWYLRYLSTTNMQRLFREALRHNYPLHELREAVVSVRAKGERKTSIMRELERLRNEVDETDEDAILEVMDFLTGWSSPHIKID